MTQPNKKLCSLKGSHKSGAWEQGTPPVPIGRHRIHDPMYGVFAYISEKDQPNVGKHTYHAWIP